MTTLQEKHFDLREKELKYRPQAEVVYNSTLPYAEHVDEESEYALTAIKTNLSKAVLLKELRPGVIYWTSQLTRYIRLYGFKFSKEDHVLFVKLFYEIVTIPDLEGLLVEQLCCIMAKLLKKRHLLDRRDLNLDWKPLYKLSERMLYSKMEPMGLEWIPSNMDSKVQSLIRTCRSYFSPTCTQDMLEEWKPLLCPFDIVMSKGIKYLELYLPTLVFSEDERNCSWRKWLHEFLTLWKSCQNGPSWEVNLISLFARLSHNNIGYIDWEPYISLLFTRMLRSMQIPVGKLQQTAALAGQLPIESACLWIISMMGGKCSKLVLGHLRHLLEATETFFHPSNTGKWCISLHSFIQNIATKFVNRIYRERYKTRHWEPKIPEPYLIQDEDIEEFVKILKPTALMALYGKLGPAAASKVLLNLANLRPDLVIPDMLDKTFIALGTLTEPHQVRACLSALSCVINPGIKEFPETRKHVIPLLFECLPALDPNDLPKSMSAFQFISTCLSLVPMVDCSKAVQVRTDLSESEHEICVMTSQFEDFAMQYMERCFVLLEGMNQGHESHSHESLDDRDLKITQSEGISGMVLITSTAIMLHQSSTAIYKLCLERLFRFVTTNLLEGHVAMSSAATLCAVTAKVNPTEGFAKFVPYFCNAILDYFAETPDAKSEEKIDKRLLWDFKILAEICHVGTECLLLYKDLLFDVARHGVEMSAKDCYESATKIIKFCIRGWTIFFNSDRRSVSHSFDQDPSAYLAIRDWGTTTNPWETDMQWHVPSESELEAAFEALDHFLMPCLQKLSDFNCGTIDLSKDELHKMLYLVKEILVACYALLPVDNTDLVPLEVLSKVNLKNWSVHTTELLPYYDSVMAKGNRRNLRSEIFHVARSTLQKVLASREDDVKSVCFIIDIYSQCALMHEQQKAEFDQHWKVFSAYKTAMRNPLRRGKQRERLSIIDRAVLQHQMRVLAVERSSYTKINHEIMVDLINLSTSHYMKVRANAQALFFHGLGLVPSSAYRQYIPLILKHLDKSSNAVHKEFKGALYLLIGKPKSRSFLAFYHKWDVLTKVWPALINAPHSNKPSITKQYEKLALKIQAHFNTIAIERQVSNASIDVALKIIRSSSVPKVQEFDTLSMINEGTQHLLKCNEANFKMYQVLVNQLIDLYESGELTWKYSELVLGMLSLMLRHDVNIPVRLVKLFVSLLVDDAISVRMLAIGCVGSILKQQKRKHMVKMQALKDIMSLQDLPKENVDPGDRADNCWHQYNSSDLPDTKEKFDNTTFIDKTHWGYYVWPFALKTYAPWSQQPKLNIPRDQLTESEVPIYDHMTDPVFVQKLIGFLCLENEKGKDKFDDKKMDMFRGLFRNFGDTFVASFKPHILRLVEEKQESHHRCAAELIAGMAMGSKHWDFDKVNSMWSWMIPALRTALSNISTETLKDWDKTFSNIIQNRDPRRIHWILDFLTTEPSNASSSALIEASKLFVFQGGMHQQEWRVPELLQKMLEHIEPLLGHPYKNIRNRIGSVLASIFLYDIELLGKHQQANRTPSADEFVSRIKPRLEILYSEDTPPLSNTSSTSSISVMAGASSQDIVMEDFSAPLAMPIDGGANIPELATLPPEIVEQIQNGIKKLLPSGSTMPNITGRVPMNILQALSSQKLTKSDQVRTPVDEDEIAMQVDSDTERNETVRIFKTVMKWIVSAQRSTLQPFRISFLKLLPLICKMYPVDQQGADEELHRDTRLCLSCLAQSFVKDNDIPKVVETIQNIVATNSWHTRQTVLSYIQVFVFANLFSVSRNKAAISAIKKVIITLLEDEQHEVSSMAGVTLSGMLQCGALTLDDALLALGNTLRKTKIQRKKRGSSTDSFANQKQVLKRHAGVLVLSACVLSAPYTVPDWMPKVVMDLSDHLHDPHPIQGTVKRTLSNFRRTHHDNWHEDKQKFSSDELSILTDLLVSPSYYA